MSTTAVTKSTGLPTIIVVSSPLDELMSQREEITVANFEKRLEAIGYVMRVEPAPTNRERMIRGYRDRIIAAKTSSKDRYARAVQEIHEDAQRHGIEPMEIYRIGRN